MASLQVLTSLRLKKRSPAPFSSPSWNSQHEGMKMLRSAAVDAFTRSRLPLAWRTASRSLTVHQSWRCGRALQQQLFPPSLKSLDGSIGVRRRRQSCTQVEGEEEVRKKKTHKTNNDFGPIRFFCLVYNYKFNLASFVLHCLLKKVIRTSSCFHKRWGGTLINLLLGVRLQVCRCCYGSALYATRQLRQTKSALSHCF